MEIEQKDKNKILQLYFDKFYSYEDLEKYFKGKYNYHELKSFIKLHIWGKEYGN